MRGTIRIACLAPAALCATVLGAEGPMIRNGSLEVLFDVDARTLRISDRELGPILEDGEVLANIGGREVSTRGARAIRVVVGPKRILLGYPRHAVEVRAPSPDRVEVRATGSFPGPAACRARFAAGPRAMIAILDEEREADRGVLTTILGPAEIPGARSVFDPARDLAITASAAGAVRWSRGEGWAVRTEAPAGQGLLSLRILRHYYRDALKIPFYASIRKRPRWPVAPVVAMTWYGIEGWKGNPAQTKAWLFPQIDWVAEHLLPYAERLVFQLDDNYAKDDDRTMREISDYIRSRGLVPGIWFTPFVTAPKEEVAKHPDWFLHGPDGKPIGTFGGVSYRGRSTLNVTNREAVEAWYGMWWRKASETWNFEFFKIDGQPQVAAAYRKAEDGHGIEGYREGLRIGRRIVGPGKFINGCWGIPLDAIGIVDGARTGPDTGNRPHAIDVILRWNFLNNVCWWSDPDAAANLFRATVERARLNAQARVLTGQQFLTDDVWTKVPSEIRRVWQRSFPTLDIRPVDLYRIEDGGRYDLFQLRIAKPWGTRDVVGLSNYGGAPAEKILDLARLRLSADRVHVFEYWSATYLGDFPGDAKIPRVLEAYEGELFSIVPAAEDRPVLVSTSRHLTQGGLDLDALAWARDGEAWVARGRSSHLVAGDPYIIAFAAGPWRIAAADATAGEVRSARTGAVARAEVVPARSGSLDWEVRFARVEGGRADVVPRGIRLRSGREGRLTIASVGTRGIRWRARPSDPRIRIDPARGELGPWPARAEVAVSVDAEGLPRGERPTGEIAFEMEGGVPRVLRAGIRLFVPPPENLALRARARASSAWGGGYRAARANDGDPKTRWNSREGDKDGCWLELAWPEKVAFDRVIIDECMEFGPRIEAWRLAAGDGALREIARGERAGRRKRVDLAEPLEARRLRLTIEKASVVPTIWEFEVYRMKEKP